MKVSLDVVEKTDFIRKRNERRSGIHTFKSVIDREPEISVELKGEKV